MFGETGCSDSVAFSGLWYSGKLPTYPKDHDSQAALAAEFPIVWLSSGVLQVVGTDPDAYAWLHLMMGCSPTMM